MPPTSSTAKQAKIEKQLKKAVKQLSKAKEAHGGQEDRRQRADQAGQEEAQSDQEKRQAGEEEAQGGEGGPRGPLLILSHSCQGQNSIAVRLVALTRAQRRHLQTYDRRLDGPPVEGEDQAEELTRQASASRLTLRG